MLFINVLWLLFIWLIRRSYQVRDGSEQCSSYKESIGMGESVCLGKESRNETHSRVVKKQLGTERHGSCLLTRELTRNSEAI